MSINKWITASANLYAFLLRLYPKEYRESFSTDMQQVFRDECQNRYDEKGAPGVIQYWFKVVPDLAYTALVEHVSSPAAAWGLMAPVPNAPLPWKGIFLVLLPGLVYLIAQIGQYSGKYWYLPVYYRAAIYLMIPVVIIWILKKQFPIWGLIPLGLFIKLARTSSTIVLGYVVSIAENISSLQSVLRNLLRFWPVITIICAAALIIFLLWRFRKAYSLSHQFYWWIGGLAVFTIGYVLYNYIYFSLLIFGDASIENLKRTFLEQEASLYWILNEALTITLVVCIGTLFMKRHGFFSIFIFVGYIMPTMIVGFPWNLDQSINQDLAILLMGIAVIGYRILLTIVSPLWMARMKSQNERRRATIIPIAIAIAIHGIMLFNQAIFFPDQVIISFYSIVNALFTVGIITISFLLAVSLYSAGEFESAQDSEHKKRSAEIYVYS